MNAADRIQQAIQKLETLKGGSKPGPWIADQSSEDVRYGPSELFLAEPPTMTDAELIVTLHRTIDPQLAILRHGWDAVAGAYPMPTGAKFRVWYGPVAARALDLANAIIGEDA